MHLELVDVKLTAFHHGPRPELLGLCVAARLARRADLMGSLDHISAA